MDKTTNFYVGQRVKWNDPGLLDYEPGDRHRVLNRVFVIDDLEADEGVASISEVDGFSSAEVYLSELIPLEDASRRRVKRKYGRIWESVDLVRASNATALDVSVFDGTRNADWLFVVSIDKYSLMVDNTNQEMLLVGKSDAWATTF